MGLTVPDAQLWFIVDRDNSNNGWSHAKVVYHDGSVPVEDAWPGNVTEGDFDDLQAAAATSQAALDTEAGTMMGSWFTSKPAGFAVALRYVLNATTWPV